MGAKKVFGEKQIVDAAFSILRKRGFQNVSARTISVELSSSTMPIYSTLKSMPQLGKLLKEKALIILEKYQKQSYGQNELLNPGIGYIVFAQKETHLFRFLFQEHPIRISQKQKSNFGKSVAEDFGSDSLLYKTVRTIPDRNGFVFKNWVFIHGLASLVNSGVLKLMSNDSIYKLLSETGSAFYAWENQKTPTRGTM
jgi:hypothetical protein